MATIVLLHPFPVDHRFWDDVRPALEAAGHRVMAPDLPGFGTSPAWPGWTMDEAADRLAPSIPPGSVVAGLSMGGYLAQAIVARHPDRVGRLVLADTRAEGETPEGLDARREAAEGLRRDGTAQFIRAFVPRALGPAPSEHAVRRLTELASAQTADAMAEATMAISRRPDRTDLLARITVPTLVIVGEHDAVTPPPLATMMAQGIPDARLVVIGGSGHMTALEEPGEWAELVIEFID
ncbi:MAG: alpha/beta fold hydrolase [Miltoncostaeaceae bacterium]